MLDDGVEGGTAAQTCTRISLVGPLATLDLRVSIVQGGLDRVKGLKEGGCLWEEISEGLEGEVSLIFVVSIAEVDQSKKTICRREH